MVLQLLIMLQMVETVNCIQSQCQLPFDKYGMCEAS